MSGLLRAARRWDVEDYAGILAVGHISCRVTRCLGYRYHRLLVTRNWLGTRKDISAASGQAYREVLPSVATALSLDDFEVGACKQTMEVLLQFLAGEGAAQNT